LLMLICIGTAVLDCAVEHKKFHRTFWMFLAMHAAVVKSASMVSEMVLFDVGFLWMS
jgi:hypothetical protein